MTSGVRPEISPSSATPELESGKACLAWSRLLGKLSACIFFVAALAVLDGLQDLVRHEFNEISLVPGETAVLTGALPQNATRLADLTVEMEELSGLTFTPVNTYKGFWMGGNMWRAELAASSTAAPGKGTLTVVDMVPLKKVGQSVIRDEDGRSSQKTEASKAADTTSGSQPSLKEKEGTILGQNPALIYAIRIWPTAADREAAERSLLRRTTGFAPFGVAGVATAFAFLAGLANSLMFSRAEARLARHGVYFIHGIKSREGAPCASFAHAGQDSFAPGDAVLLCDMRWRQQGSGVIAEKDRTKGFALFSPKAPPRYGWLVVLTNKDGARA